MAVPPTTPLERALARIGTDASVRRDLVAALKDWEGRNAVDGEEVRETTTGPLVDLLHAEADCVSHEVRFRDRVSRQEHALTISLLYRSKVGREYALTDAAPDHVWEPQTTKLLLSMARDARTALIGGAYAGDHVVAMMAFMAPNGGTCHCFEPNREQADMLRRNAEANALTNYRLSSDGLWSTTTKLVMVGSDSHAHPEVHTGQEGDLFQGISIDDYCRDNSISSLDIIMLDIEGGEIEALKGAGGMLAQGPETAPEVIFEIHRSYVDWSDGLASTPICSLLLEHGYSLYAIRDYQGNVHMPDAPVEVVPIETCYLEGPPHGFNIFASKRPDCIERHDLRICENVSPKLLKHRDPALHQPLTHRA
ncbi:MAG: FkbM family methyltransferase [Pseudomonadota bacterium]